MKIDHPNIIIINPFGIGDVIFSTPLVEALKKEYPDSSISYICNKRSREAISSNPSLNKIFIYEKDDYRDLWKDSKLSAVRAFWRFVKDIKKERFDIAIDLSLNYQAGLLFKLLGVRTRVGLNYRNRGKFLTNKMAIDGFNDKHVIEHYLDVLTLLGIDLSKADRSPRVYVTDDDKRWAGQFLELHGYLGKERLIGIMPGCGASWGADAKCRRWDPEGFVKVCDELVRVYNAKIIIFGDSKEAHLCAEIQSKLKDGAIMACGKTSIREFLGLLSECDVAITNDGGPLHMAVGVSTKTVSIFGPVDERIYGPYPPAPGHIAVSAPGISCRPCYKRFKYTLCNDRKCLSSISPEMILKAVGKLLGAAG